MRALPASLSLIAGSLAWTLALAFSDPAPTAAGLVAAVVTMWVWSVASITGMIVSRSRWARNLGLAVVATHGLWAATRAVDAWWWVGLAVSTVAAAALTGPWLKGAVRSLPAAAGPPARSVLLPLVITGVPLAVGLTSDHATTTAVVAIVCLTTAYWFIRTLPGAIAIVRVILPLVLLAATFWLGRWQSVVAALVATGAISVLAWHSSVLLSVSPLIERGTVVPIPPELAPKDVLDAAGIDDHGRPRP